MLTKLFESPGPSRLHLSGRRLKTLLRPLEIVSEVWPFDATDYYAAEMGQDIKRQLVSFEALVSIERLAEIKRLTNDLEARICDDLALPRTARPVNLDPGYLTTGKLVLATTKDASHRLYLGQGIYAEVTLRFEHGQWRPWPWTYPDYAADTYHQFLEQVRLACKQQLLE